MMDFLEGASNDPNPSVNPFNPTSELEDITKPYCSSLADYSTPERISEVVFIDTTVQNYQNLLTGLSSNIYRVILNSQQSGIEQVNAILEDFDNLKAVHVISHGQAGAVKLGATRLDSQGLTQYANDLQGWGDALAPDGDLLFYGCNVAAGEQGASFIQELSEITGADVAASTDNTGNSNLGGDWILEAEIGEVETQVFALSGLDSLLNLTASDLSNVSDLSQLVIADFIDLQGTLNSDSALSTYSASNVSGYIGDAGTDGNFGTSDDVALEISNATITFSDNTNDGIDNYTYSITNAQLSFRGIPEASFSGTVNITGDDTELNASLTSLELALNNFVNLTGDFSLEVAPGGNLNFATTGASLSAEIDASTGVDLSGVDGTVLITESGIAYEASGSASVKGLDGVTLTGNLSAQGNTTGANVTLDSTLLTDGVSQLTGTGLALDMSGLTTVNGDLTFEFRDADNSIVAIGSNLNASVAIGSDVSGSISGGSLGLVWYGQDNYALQGSGGFSADTDFLQFTGDLGFEINKTGELVNESLGSETLVFNSISEVVQFNASNLDLVLTTALKNALETGAKSLQSIAADLIPTFETDSEGNLVTDSEGDPIQIGGSFLTESIPGTDVTLDSLLGISAYLSLGDVVEDYLSTGTGQTLQGLLTQINNEWSTDLPTPFNLDFVFNSSGIDLSFAADYSLTETINLGLPASVAEFGLVDLEGNANLNVFVDTGIDFDLGIDFGTPSNSSFTLNRFDFTADATASDIVLGAYFGPLGVSLGSSDAGKQQASTTIDLEGSLTYDSSNGFSIAGGSNSIDVVLPVYASIAGTDLTTGTPPTITLNGDPFGGTGVIFSHANFEQLLNFKNFDVTDVLYTLQGLFKWAKDFQDYDVMATEIPLVDLTLGDALNFASSLNDQVLSQIDFYKTTSTLSSGASSSLTDGKLIDSSASFESSLAGDYIQFGNGKIFKIQSVSDEQTLVLAGTDSDDNFASESYVIYPEIRTLEDLITSVNNSGVLPSGISISYNASTNEFTIPFEFAQTLDSLNNIGLDLGLELGELSLSTSAQTAVNASVDGRIDLIIDFDGETGEEGLSFFLDNVNLNGAIDFNVSDLGVAAQLGYLGLSAGGSGTGSAAQLQATVGTALRDSVTNKTRFNLNDLLDGNLLDSFDVSFQGDAFASLKGLSVDGGLGNIAIAPNVELGVYLPDLGNPTGLQVVNQPVTQAFNLQTAIDSNLVTENGVIVVLPDITEVLSLKNLSFANIINGIQAGIDFLSDTLVDNPFYTTVIPSINTSLEESFTFLDDLSASLAEAANNPAGVLQEVEDSIESALGFNDNNSLPSNEQLFSLSLNGNFLDIHLSWEKLFADTYDFNLDLQTIKELSGNSGAAALDAIDSLADLNGGGSLLFEAIADLNFDIAISLTSLSSGTPEIALRDYDSNTNTGTFARIGARVEGTGLDLSFKAGPLDIGVAGGLVVLDGDGQQGQLDNNDWAGLFVGIDQQAGSLADDGLYYTLQESFTDNLDLDVTGGFNVSLPIQLDVLGAQFNLDPIEIGTNPNYGNQGLWELFKHLADSSYDGGFDPLVMTFPDIQGEFAALGGDFSLLSLLNDPSFILDGVDLAVGGLEDILDSNLAEDLPLLGDKLATAATFLRDMRQGLLGDLRGKLSGNGKAIEILQQSLFDVFGPSRLNLLQDSTNDSIITLDDVQIGWFDAQGSLLESWEVGNSMPTGVDAIQFDMALGGNLYGTGVDLPLDFNLAGFSLDVDGGFGLDIEWGFDFGFGLSLSDSFYLTAAKDTSNPELELNISAFLDGSPNDPNVTTPFSATGQLLFLEANLTDNNPNGKASGVYGGLSLDLVGNERGRLTLDRMLGGRYSEIFDVDFGVEADLDLQATLSLAGAEGLPRLRGDLQLDWDWDVGSAVTDPGVDLANFAVDLGSYVDNFLQPIAQRINDTLKPLEPVITLFTEEIPGLDVILDDPTLKGLINALLKIKGRSPIDWSFLEEAQQMLGLVDVIANMGTGENWLLLGDITGLGTATPGVDTSGVSLDQSKIDALSNQLVVDGKAVRQTSITSGSKKTARSGFQVFPYLKDISNWMSLLTGGDATLFTYELPFLEFGADFRVLLATYGIPKVASIDINAIAGFSAFADLGFGYDTFGIRQSIETGNPLYALDGFFVMDFDLAGNEKDEFGLEGYVGLEGSVKLAVARGGVDGRLTLAAGLDMQDIGKSVLTKDANGYVTDVEFVSDGKIRGSELATMWEYQNGGLANLFNLSASVGIEANAFGDIKIPFKGWTKIFRKTLFKKTLWSDTYNAPNVQPVLAEKVGSTLYLNSGSRAGNRLYGNIEDGGEYFTLYTDGNEVGVEFDGYYQTFSGITKVVGDGGVGDDTFDATRLDNVTVEISGGVGDDMILSGSGAAIFEGGTGDDTLDASRSTANSILRGDAGDDDLTSGSGNDTLEGGEGDDRLTAGAGNDTLAGGLGADRLSGEGDDDTYVFENDFDLDRFSDTLGSNTFDFSAVTKSLDVTINRRGVTAYYVSSDGSSNEVKGGSAVDRVILGTGDDTVTISDFEAGNFNLEDTDGNDTYRVRLNSPTGSQGQGIINLTDNSGTFDQVIVEQTSLLSVDTNGNTVQNAIALNQNQVLNGRETLNYTAGVERLTITGKAAQFDGNNIVDFGGNVSLTNSDNGGISRLGTTDLRVIANSVDFQSQINSDAIIVETLNTIEVDQTLNAVQNGYMDLRTYGDNSNIELAADLKVSTGLTANGLGNGWIRLTVPDGSILNTNGSQILASGSHLMLKAKDSLGTTANPLLTQVAQLTTVTSTHGTGDVVLQESNDLILTNLETTASVENGGLTIPNGLGVTPTWVEDNSWIASLSNTWRNAITDGNEGYAIAVGNGNLNLTLTGANALLTLANGSLVNQTATGNINLVADDMDFSSGTGQIQGSNELKSTANQASLLYRLGSAANANSTPALDLSNTDLAALANGFSSITIGKLGGSNEMEVGDILQTSIQPEFRDNVTLLSNTLNIIGDAHATDSATVDLISTGNIFFTSTGKITANNIVKILADSDSNGSGGIIMSDGAVVNATNSLIDADATENIVLGLLTTTSNVTVDSSQGAILDADTNAGLDIQANTAILNALTGIGTASNALETEVNYLEANGGNGSIWIDDQGGLILGEISSQVGLSANSTIKVTTTGAMQVKENVSSNADVTLQAIDLVTAGQDLTVIGGVEVTGESVTLQAGDDLHLQQDSVIEAESNITIQSDVGNAESGGTQIDLDGRIWAEEVLIQSETDVDTININVQELVGNTLVQANDSDDFITVNQLPSLDISKLGESDRDELTLDGQEGDDTYLVNVTGGNTDYRINVFDTGFTNFDPNNGNADNDELTIVGTTIADQFLLRASEAEFENGGVAFVGLLHGATDGDPSTLVERINYNRNLGNLIVNSGEGNDSFSLDNNWTRTQILGGTGEDSFQVGQIFKTQRDANAGVAQEDWFETIASTRGYLSNGITSLTTIEGGEDNDTFTVYRNAAALDLQGQNGDDLFVIRSFAAEGSYTSEVESGEGFDTIEYIVNAPVNVNGGSGTDTLRIIGTEFSDKFYITKDAIFGAGRTITYEGIEIVEIDGAEGKDEFYVFSTYEGVETRLFGGLGSDYFSLGGDTDTVQAGIPTPDDFFSFNFIEPDGTINPQLGPHTVNDIQGTLIIDGFGGEGSASLAEPVLLPGETNILPSDGNILSFSGNGQGGKNDSMTVNTSDLQAAALAFSSNQSNDPNDLIGKTLEISQGNGLRRFWQIVGLVVNGSTTTLTLLNPMLPASEWGLPDSNSEFAITSLSSNFFVDEDTVQDQVTVFEDGDTSNNTGTLTENLLIGLGLGTNGVEYSNFEQVEILLGQGNDNFTVENTANGSITAVHGGGGSDTLTALDRGSTDIRNDGEIELEASLALFGDTTEDGSRYSSSRSVYELGVANGFTNPGNDVINASAMTENVVIYGGDGNDRIDGSQAGDHLAGGAGDDTINGFAGNDSIYGDSGFNLDMATRELTVPTTDTAGSDTIDAGTGDDIVFGDHGVIEQTPETQRIQTTGNVKSIRTNEFANGADDEIEGGQGSDRILGGAGSDEISDIQGDNIILGDHGFIDYSAGETGLTTVDRIQTTDTDNGDSDTITTSSENDIILGGTGDDVVNASDGNNIVLGDFGEVILSSGKLTEINSTNTSLSGNDQITTGANNDVIVAGNGNDAVTAGNGKNIVIGDNGSVTYAANTLNRIQTTAPSQGGSDRITTGDGEDIVLGGTGVEDVIETGASNDIVLGDNGVVDYLINDNDATDIDLITATETTIGGRDVIETGAGNDIVIGGTANDEIAGGDNNDLIFGDSGKVEGDIDANLLPLDQPTHPFTFTSIATQNADGGGNDVIAGNAGDDIVIGGQGADTLTGNEGDDDLIGGHNVAGGHDTGDAIDGGAGVDAIAGDNASILRKGDAISDRNRQLIGSVIYDEQGNPQVTSTAQANPTGASERTVTLFDHSDTPLPNTSGNDFIAGGAEDDKIFGQLGNDTIQGDGAISLDIAGIGASVEDFAGVGRDGDDYIEGNGGDDVIFGNLGQDDIIGDSSSLFGLTQPSDRPTGSDTIYGGAGTQSDRNNLGNLSAEGHAEDADVILGDNGEIYRLVNAAGDFLQFTYDNYSPELSIVPRAVRLLDYIPGNPDNRGQADVIRGEAGDDIIHGMTGNDILFGDGQDDDLYGEDGVDRLYGGAGEDGIVGDNGLIQTSRNGETEILYGLTSANEQVTLSVPGPFTGVVEYITGRLTKAFTTIAWTVGYNDILYGGLGDDFMHGGSGDDAMSGAEASAEFYSDVPSTNLNPLGYDPTTRKFADYDANNPRTKIADFLLNFEATDANGNKIEDGKDRMFGDLGNDWLVGGTGHDRLFGGMGDDLMNADDNHDTNGGLNDAPDSAEFADGDFAFGGGGLDVLIANTGNDRLIDWKGEFNSYIVPFSPFGNPTVVRSPSPLYQQFVLDLGRTSGADQSLTEPNGEVGLVTPQDPEWTDQNGAPRDPQPGNGSAARDTQGAPEDDTSATPTDAGSTPGGTSSGTTSSPNNGGDDTPPRGNGKGQNLKG